MMPESPAKTFWNMHQFVDYNLVLLLLFHPVKRLQKLNRVKCLCLHRVLHHLPQSMAPRNRSPSRRPKTPQTLNSIQVNMRHIKHLNYLNHPLFQVRRILVFHLLPPLLQSLSEIRVFNIYYATKINIKTIKIGKYLY